MSRDRLVIAPRRVRRRTSSPNVSIPHLTNCRESRSNVSTTSRDDGTLVEPPPRPTDLVARAPHARDAETVESNFLH